MVVGLWSATAVAQSGPWIPGVPGPVRVPPGALGRAPTAPGAPLPGAPPASAAGPLPAGAVDAQGMFVPAFLEAESAEILRALVAALPSGKRERVDGIPFAFDRDTREVNAFAGCENGASFMAMTLPLARAIGHLSEAKAVEEQFGGQRVSAYGKLAADAVRADRPIPEPPPGFYAPGEALEPRKLARQRVVLDEALAFVLGHELAHHYLGHTGCANGDRGRGIDPATLGRVASRAVPMFNQPNEASSDVSGTDNLLDAGVSRPGGMTEGGGLIVLGFFGQLSQLTPAAAALGFLRTHPAPQLRVPIVQTAANAWRARKGSPLPLPGLPFPFPLPGF